MGKQDSRLAHSKSLHCRFLLDSVKCHRGSLPSLELGLMLACLNRLYRRLRLDWVMGPALLRWASLDHEMASLLQQLAS